MAKGTQLRGPIKFKEITLTEDLAARILAIDGNGNLVDRPAIDGSGFITTALADGHVWIGDGGGVATAVDTASVGDIDADATNGLTIKAGTIVDADINGSAAIAYSKLSLAESIVNADIADGAAIAYAKLNLADAILDADINASAAITRTKLASGTAYRLVVNDADGVISENGEITGNRALVSDANGQPTHSVTTDDQIGYLSTLTGDVQSQLDNEIATQLVAAIVKNPTAAEHGYAITWDNTTGQWDLTDPVIQGIPLGGNTRQVLAKIDATDWNAGWTDLVLTDITDVSALAADLNLLAGAAAAGLSTTDVANLVGTDGNIQDQLDGKQSKTLGLNSIWVGNSSNIASPLGPGTNGYVLTSVAGVPTWAAVSAGTPPGSDTQVIFNDGGSFGADAGITYDKTNNALTIGNATIHATSSGSFFAISAANYTASGTSNIGIGSLSLRDLTSGQSNIALGPQSCRNNADGHANVGIGSNALLSNVSGDDNIAIGNNAGSILTGDKNIIIGRLAADNLTTGSSNVIIGADIDAPSATANGQLSIQNAIFGVDNTATGTTASTGKIGVYVAAPTASLDVAASTTAKASLRIRGGTAPSSPNAGDIWFDGTDLKFYDGTTIKTWVELIDEDDMASDSDTKAPTQQSVKAYVDAQSSSALMRSKLTVASAQILNSNSSPITLISAPGANKAIRIISLSMLIDFNSTAYATNTLTTITQGGLNAVSAAGIGINAGGSTLLQVHGTTSSQLWSIIENKPIVWTTSDGNPTDGDSDIHFDIVYQIVEML